LQIIPFQICLKSQHWSASCESGSIGLAELQNCSNGTHDNYDPVISDHFWCIPALAGNNCDCLTIELNPCGVERNVTRDAIHQALELRHAELEGQQMNYKGMWEG
jgi:hypothetical protein